MWSRVATMALCDFIRNEERRGRPFAGIFDLLSEIDYQFLINWSAVQRRCGVRIYHRVFKSIAGPDILPELGRILGMTLDRFKPGVRQ